MSTTQNTPRPALNALYEELADILDRRVGSILRRWVDVTNDDLAADVQVIVGRTAETVALGAAAVQRIERGEHE